MIRFYLERLRPDRMALIETRERFVEIDFFADHLHVYQKSDAVIRTRVLDRLNYYRLLGVDDHAVVLKIRQRYQELLKRVFIEELKESGKRKRPDQKPLTGPH
ncbi:MAG: hypothetical protein ACFB10_06875 [Salibacteraceae bacterium]